MHDMLQEIAHRALPGLLVAMTLYAVGCVERTISITSEPSGALVHLNDEAVGRTPLTVPFKFYGLYDVRLEAEGHDPLWTTHKAAAPWWETIGLDLLAEMVPHAKVELDWHFALTPATAPDKIDVDLLLDHARQMRAATGRK